jgi:hypothetical protein
LQTVAHFHNTQLTFRLNKKVHIFQFLFPALDLDLYISRKIIHLTVQFKSASNVQTMRALKVFRV